MTTKESPHLPEQLRAAEDIAGEVVLHPRAVQFDFSRSPLHWIPGELVASHAISGLNLILPLGERGFVEIFHRALPYARDPEIREQMIGFMGQESMHAESHNYALWEFLKRNGIDSGPMLMEADYLFDRAIAALDKLPERLQRRIVLQGLAVIAGLEHFTAVGGDWILNQDFESLEADPAVTDLFRWHGAEEVEHRSVAWNVARHFGASRPRLITFFLGASAGFACRVHRSSVVDHPEGPHYEKYETGPRGARDQRRDAARCAAALGSDRHGAGGLHAPDVRSFGRRKYRASGCLSGEIARSEAGERRMTLPTPTPTIEGRIAEMRAYGRPPAFYRPSLEHDPVLLVLEKLIGPATRLLGMLLRDAPMPPAVDRTQQLVLLEREVVAVDENVVRFKFGHPNGAILRPWRPGAHLDIVLPSGKLRQYSLVGDPADRHDYRIAVRRIPDGGGGSMELHESVSVGDQVSIRGPRNAFPLSLIGHMQPVTTRRFHFIAGGIGITPILSMLRAADEAGVDWTMVYTGRHRDSLPFLDELAKYGNRITIRTDDEHGLPTAKDLVPQAHPDIAIYCCGPAPLLEAVREEVAGQVGVEFHYERFTAPPILNGEAFTVQLGRGGPIVPVPADRSVLDVVAEVVPSIGYSCRQGFCTTCKLTVLDGTVDHRDTILNDAQHKQGDMLICVSRAAADARLVLDVKADV